MTSPDHAQPDGSFTPTTIGQLQNYDKAAAGAAQNAWMRTAMEQVRLNFLNQLLSIVLRPLALLIGMITGENPDDFDTLDEIQQNLVPAIIRAPIKILVDLVGDIPVVGGAFEEALAGWMSTTHTTATQTRSGILQGWGAGSTSGTDMGVYSVFADIKTALAAGYSTATITTSTTWTKPVGAVNEIVVIGIGSGLPGANGKTNPEVSQPGGLGGGYLADTFKPSAVPSTVAITIGTNGAATSFGSLLVTTPGSGGIATTFGYSDTTSLPGKGGDGGAMVGTAAGDQRPSTAGKSTPLAAGGARGVDHFNDSTNGGAGGAGGAVDTTTTTRCGGAGGGGGGCGSYNVGVSWAGGDGGVGGFPGGGGGAGGNKGQGIGTGSPGAGAQGGNGVMWLFWK
ncbi:hypothetical protein HH308_06375 [Gordonia sp. TBRC 11910]|uniref:Minor tail protein n=1 Tax=Gordonia asplenii TaxID=2725283 RepID=A0A848KZG2_9ACTN|nr:hypothetical protein [Gordonia asplenii]NMO00838.1 hypothetical protein [Gordonia asplenii]